MLLVAEWQSHNLQLFPGDIVTIFTSLQVIEPLHLCMTSCIKIVNCWRSYLWMSYLSLVIQLLLPGYSIYHFPPVISYSTSCYPGDSTVVLIWFLLQYLPVPIGWVITCIKLSIYLVNELQYLSDWVMELSILWCLNCSIYLICWWLTCTIYPVARWLSYSVYLFLDGWVAVFFCTLMIDLCYFPDLSWLNYNIYMTPG